MKLIHIIDSGGLYGAETMLLHLMSDQIKMGITPIMVSIGIPGEAEKPVEAECRRRDLKVQPFRMRPGLNVSGALSILRFARQEKAVLLHTHGYKANILFGLMPRMVRRLPMVTTLHGWTWVAGFSRMRIYEWLDGISIHFADRVILVNEGMKKHHRLRRLSSRSIKVVENGIPPFERIDEKHLQPEIVKFTQQGFTVGAIGRLSTEKGLETLLETVAGLVTKGKDIYLLFLGEGGLRETLRRKASFLGIDNRIMMPGYVTNAYRYLSLFKAIAMPSLTEGLPMVLLESMAAGVPIIATRVGAIPKLLGQGRAGFLIDPGDRKGLEKSLLTVMEDNALVQKKIDFADELVRKFYSSRIMAEKYKKIYCDVLNQNRSAI